MMPLTQLTNGLVLDVWRGGTGPVGRDVTSEVIVATHFKYLIYFLIQIKHFTDLDELDHYHRHHRDSIGMLIVASIVSMVSAQRAHSSVVSPHVAAAFPFGNFVWVQKKSKKFLKLIF